MAEKNDTNEKEMFANFTTEVKKKLDIQDGYISVTDILANMTQAKYQKGRNENMQHNEISFQKIRPVFPYNHWMPDILPWARHVKVGEKSFFIFLLFIKKH